MSMSEEVIEKIVRELQSIILRELRKGSAADMREVKHLRVKLGMMKPDAAMYHKFDPIFHREYL